MNVKRVWIAALIAGFIVIAACARRQQTAQAQAAGAGQSQDPTSPDWASFRGPGSDGHVSALPAAMPTNKKPLWQKPVAGRCDAGIAVAEGRVVVCDSDEVKDEGKEEKPAKEEAKPAKEAKPKEKGNEAKSELNLKDYYRCYDLDGAEKWVKEFKNGREMDQGPGPRATPVIYKGKVYVVSAFGELRCLDLNDGHTVWEKDYAKEFAGADLPSWGYCSSPLIADGKLIINPGGKDAAVVALDPDTGKVQWQGKGVANNYSSFIAGKFGGVDQVIGFDAENLCGWALKDGKQLWKVKVNPGPGYIVPTPVKLGERLFTADASNDSVLYEFGKDGVINPKPVATSEDMKPEVVSSVVVGNLILGCHNGLVCLDASKAGAKWEAAWKDEDSDPYRSDFHLIVSGNTLLTLNSKGLMGLATFDAKGVKVIGKMKLSGATIMHPTVAGGRIFLRDDKALYCFDLTK